MDGKFVDHLYEFVEKKNKTLNASTDIYEQEEFIFQSAALDILKLSLHQVNRINV